MSCFIIAEAGVNHNGSEELALQLVDVAAEAGADAIKFQTFKADRLVLKGTATAEYQKAQTGSDDQYEMLKKLEISDQLHRSLISRCKEKGIEFMSTAFDEDAADFLVSEGMDKLKVPSGELTNIPFIRKLTSFNKPMILSTGMANLEEVKTAVEEVATERKRNGFIEPLADKLSILHCTSNYPAWIGDVNLLAMVTMQDTFQLPVGYSDHTDGILTACSAVALGATIIEKHFTLDRELPGPDHKASLEPDELKKMISQIREVELSLGNGVKAPRDSEIPVRDLVRRSVTLLVDKKADDILQPDDVALMRPGNGISPIDLDQVIGKKMARNCDSGTLLSWQDLVDA